MIWRCASASSSISAIVAFELRIYRASFTIDAIDLLAEGAMIPGERSTQLLRVVRIAGGRHSSSQRPNRYDQLKQISN